MPASPKGEWHVFAIQYLAPCFESDPRCSLDWAGISALGGWAAAIVTLLAVGVALSSAKSQKKAAEQAVRAEREKAEQLQKREWDRIDGEHKRSAMHLAHAFAKELAFARHLLVAKLVDWDPALFPTTTQIILESFVSEQPLPDLIFLRSCTDRLQGFEDKDAFALLTVLTRWQFFNRGPGLEIIEITHLPPDQLEGIAGARVKFGLDLLNLVETTISKMSTYYEGHNSIVGVAPEVLPGHLEMSLANLRTRVCK
jgi:hypothetical protein